MTRTVMHDCLLATMGVASVSVIPGRGSCESGLTALSAATALVVLAATAPNWNAEAGLGLLG